MVHNSYLIITPAHNESAYINHTIQSVIDQTVKPLKWIIVDDGSTDNTAEIIKNSALERDWLEYYYRHKPENQAYFSSSVHAIMEGYQRIKHLDFKYLAILDADITLPEDYYEKIFAMFEKDSQLGIASGIYENLIDGILCPVLNDRHSTPKAIQVFRREVFEQIGGFLPLKYGGEDTAACVMARMRNWKVWSFPDIKVIHHRPTGIGNAKNILHAKYTGGLYEYGMGSHPLFVVIKSLKRALLERPYIVGGLARLLGYINGFLRREPRQLSDEVVKYFRKEQWNRIIKFNRL